MIGNTKERFGAFWSDQERRSAKMESSIKKDLEAAASMSSGQGDQEHSGAIRSDAEHKGVIRSIRERSGA